LFPVEVEIADEILVTKQSIRCGEHPETFARHLTARWGKTIFGGRNATPSPSHWPRILHRTTNKIKNERNRLTLPMDKAAALRARLSPTSHDL
jgi:hypothetical protein